MRRMYNEKISVQANENLFKRERTVRVERRVIAISAIIFISLLILIGSSISAFANSRSGSTYHKYYTSIQLEKGDTLWTIADDYVIDGLMSKEDFINEVCQLNKISENDILHSGDYIVIAYYSPDLQ